MLNGGPFEFEAEDIGEPPQATSLMMSKFSQLLDRSTVYVKTRWIFELLALCLFLGRIWVTQGFYIICYGLGIYMLNLLIAFLSPQIDPDTEGPVLPTRETDEFRPFQRRLPEFQFWESCFGATLMSITATFFGIFNLPVFWPILLAYFLLLFGLTMRQQIAHMIKHQYLPFSTGKKVYTSQEPVF